MIIIVQTNRFRPVFDQDCHCRIGTVDRDGGVFTVTKMILREVETVELPSAVCRVDPHDTHADRRHIEELLYDEHGNPDSKLGRVGTGGGKTKHTRLFPALRRE